VTSNQNKQNMATTTISVTVADEVIMNKIYMIRGQKVMLDRDLAELYGVETKQLKQAVRRNLNRFPTDFLFEMDKDEFEDWRTQYAPFCFTEQGVTMLSCILNSERAIAVNIQVIRIFTRMRELLFTHKDILLQLEKIDRRVAQHDKDIQLIFEYLKKLLTPPEQSERRRIGFRRQSEEQ
jgi:phage regulator Rha-like protein